MVWYIAWKVPKKQGLFGNIFRDQHLRGGIAFAKNIQIAVAQTERTAVLLTAGLQGNVPGYPVEDPAVICGKKQGFSIASALKDGACQQNIFKNRMIRSKFLDTPADAGFQIPGPEMGRSAVKQFSCILGKNGRTDRSSGGGDLPDLLQMFIQKNCHILSGIMKGQAAIRM